MRVRNNDVPFTNAKWKEAIRKNSKKAKISCKSKDSKSSEFMKRVAK